jgi:hypothetical protein
LAFFQQVHEPQCGNVIAARLTGPDFAGPTFRNCLIDTESQLSQFFRENAREFVALEESQPPLW